MALIPKIIRAQLQENGRRQKPLRDTYARIDFLPVIRLYTPDADAIWLLTEEDPDTPDIFYGLTDLGLGSPDVGPIRLSDMERIRGRFGLPVERDHFWTPAGPISEYIKAAIEAGKIVEPVLPAPTAH